MINKKVLGVRNSPTKIRFCILDGDKTKYDFTNQSGENKIDMPKSLKTEAEIYQWVKSGINGIKPQGRTLDPLFRCRASGNLTIKRLKNYVKTKNLVWDLKQLKRGEQVILPIWHNITKQEVVDFSPSIAVKLACNTANFTVEEIANEIAELIQN